MSGPRTREYPRHLPNSDMIRVRFTTERDRVVNFTLQYEAWINDQFRPVVRYDTAHGHPHHDTLDWEGRPKEALVIAERDLDTNWQTYRSAFLRRKP